MDSLYQNTVTVPPEKVEQAKHFYEAGLGFQHMTMVDNGLTLMRAGDNTVAIMSEAIYTRELVLGTEPPRYIKVNNVSKAVRRAVSFGAQFVPNSIEFMPFSTKRSAKVRDPYGYVWVLHEQQLVVLGFFKVGLGIICVKQALTAWGDLGPLMEYVLPIWNNWAYLKPHLPRTASFVSVLIRLMKIREQGVGNTIHMLDDAVEHTSGEFLSNMNTNMVETMDSFTNMVETTNSFTNMVETTDSFT